MLIVLSAEYRPREDTRQFNLRHSVARSLGADVVILFYIVAGLCCIPCAVAQESTEHAFRVGGLLFGDLYHVVSHHTNEDGGATGAALRRGYITFDAHFSERWFGRLRFELNQSGKFETYTFEGVFKDLYVGMKLGQHRILVGLSPSRTFDLIESFWGLRYLARTPMDLQVVASRDTGVSPTDRSTQPVQSTTGLWWALDSISAADQVTGGSGWAH